MQLRARNAENMRLCVYDDLSVEYHNLGVSTLGGERSPVTPTTPRSREDEGYERSQLNEVGDSESSMRNVLHVHRKR